MLYGRMKLEMHTRNWTIDLTTGRASCGPNVISFDRKSEHAFDIAFVAGGDCSLEEQCLIAGAAAAAIRAKIGTR